MRMRLFWQDRWEGLKRLREGWIDAALGAFIMLCVWVLHDDRTFGPLAQKVAGAALVGGFTALFTRFLAVIGMFRDAISEVMLDDRWLDRRNDLRQLWHRITRRVFMPGFHDERAPMRSNSFPQWMRHSAETRSARGSASILPQKR
jgi:hypothetical protein